MRRAASALCFVALGTNAFASLLVESVFDPLTYPHHVQGWQVRAEERVGTSVLVAEDFTLRATSTITRVDWVGGWHFRRDLFDDFRISFFDNIVTTKHGEVLNFPSLAPSATIDISRVDGVATGFSNHTGREARRFTTDLPGAPNACGRNLLVRRSTNRF